MDVSDFMQTLMHALRPENIVASAAKITREADLGFLPIDAPQEAVVGALADRDIVISFLPKGKKADVAVSLVMTAYLVARSPNDGPQTAENLLHKHRRSRLFLPDDVRRIFGVVGLRDLAKAEEAAPAADGLRDIKFPAAASNPLMEPSQPK